MSVGTLVFQISGVEEDEAAKKKKETKAKAARAAVRLNDAAAWSGGGAAVTGTAAFFLGPAAPVAGVGAGLLGVISAGSWWAANRFQEIANDPPRTDFEVVTMFSPFELTFPTPATNSEETLQHYFAESMLLAEALSALLVSIERYDGFLMAFVGTGDRSRLDRESFLESGEGQLRAIKHNATSAAAMINALLQASPEVNQVWRATMEAPAIASIAPLPSDQLTQVFEQVWQTAVPMVRDLGLPEPSLQGMLSVVKDRIEAKDIRLGRAGELLNQQWTNDMEQTSQALREFAAAVG